MPHSRLPNLTADGAWGSAALLETDDAGDARSPQIAFDGSGNAVAVWQQITGGAYSIWANRFVAGSGWGSAVALESASTSIAQLIENNDTGSALSPQVAFDGNGNAAAVWYQLDGSVYNIWSNRFE